MTERKVLFLIVCVSVLLGFLLGGIKINNDIYKIAKARNEMGLKHDRIECKLVY